MRIVLQRVLQASVSIEGTVVGAIKNGVVALVGINEGDGDPKVLDYMCGKIMNLRIFEDEDGKMNLSLLDTGGKLLVVPNFTLYGDARKGRRPSYDGGASPKEAEGIYQQLLSYLSEQYPGKIESGVFQAEMQVALINDGPVTLLLDSDKLF